MNFLDLIFPKSCLECGRQDQYFCPNCLKKVAVLNHYNPKTNCFSIFAYEGVIRKGIIKLKYNFASDIASELSEICFSQLKDSSFLSSNPLILIPIPLHKSRENWRGFNQSEILGRLLSGKLKIKCDDTILVRTQAGKTQVGLKGVERVRNIRGKFAVNPKAKPDQNTTYIIFDDVATTGSTIQEAIRVLRQNGAKKVFGLTVAR